MATSAIKASGGDYTDPEAWSDALLAATTLTEREIGELYDEAYTGNYAIGGATTTSSFNWILRAASGEQSTSWDVGARFEPSASGHIFTLDSTLTLDEFAEFGGQNLGFVCSISSSAASSDECFRATGNHNVIWDSIRMRVDDATPAADTDGIYTASIGTGNTQTWTVQNCVFHNFERCGLHPQIRTGAGASDTDIQNLLMYNNIHEGGESAIGWATRSANMEMNLTAYNCVSANHSIQTLNNTSSTNNTSLTWVGDYNFDEGASDTAAPDTSWPDDGGNSIFSGTLTDNTGAGTDVHIVADLTTVPDYDLETVDDPDNDTLGQGVGTTQSGVPSVGIEGTARPVATCDIGPWEKTGIPSTLEPSIFKRFEHMPAPNPSLRM